MPRGTNTRLIRLFANAYMARFSPTDLDRAARTPLRIGLAGDAELIQIFRQMLTLDRVAPDAPFPTLTLHPLPADEPRNYWSVLEDCQMVVVLLRRQHLLGDTMYRVKEALPKKVYAIWGVVGQIEPWLRYEVGEMMAELKIYSLMYVDDMRFDSVTGLARELVRGVGGSDVAAARKLPFLRDLVASQLIVRTAKQNLMLAIASTVPRSLPWLGPIVALLGVTAETIFLTSNQLRMVLQIASLYGEDTGLVERMREVVPVVGGAFGWRALARELMGMVPGLGPGIKGSIAYAATIVTGEAARWFYKTGTHLNEQARQRIYQNAFDQAGELVEKAQDVLPTLDAQERKALVETSEASVTVDAVLQPAETSKKPDAASLLGAALGGSVGSPPRPASKRPKLTIAAPRSTQEGSASPAEPPTASGPDAAEQTAIPTAPAAEDGGPSAAPRGRSPRPKIDIERNARKRNAKTPPDSEEKKDP